MDPEKELAAKEHLKAKMLPESTYVVQSRSDADKWIDLATITVPNRTKRATVLRLALARAGLSPEDGAVLTLRVLDADSAEETKVTAQTRDSYWTIG